MRHGILGMRLSYTENDVFTQTRLFQMIGKSCKYILYLVHPGRKEILRYEIEVQTFIEFLDFDSIIGHIHSFHF